MDNNIKNLIIELIRLELLLDLFYINNSEVQLSIEKIKVLLITVKLDNNNLSNNDLTNIKDLDKLNKTQLKEFIRLNLDKNLK